MALVIYLLFQQLHRCEYSSMFPEIFEAHLIIRNEIQIYKALVLSNLINIHKLISFQS